LYLEKDSLKFKSDKIYLCVVMIKQITYQDKSIALIISSGFHQPGIKFFTPHESSQQLAYISHPTGETIQPHIHNSIDRTVQHTQEVLFIRKGKLRVDLYNNQQEYLESCFVESGDVVFLIEGGHGFEVIEDVELIEVKQGPYIGEQERTRFIGINTGAVKVVEYSKP
jgi:mannose-6-phosphate isomerase-like protein (cupin superfamily)